MCVSHGCLDNRFARHAWDIPPRCARKKLRELQNSLITALAVAKGCNTSLNNTFLSSVKNLGGMNYAAINFHQPKNTSILFYFVFAKSSA